MRPYRNARWAALSTRSAKWKGRFEALPDGSVVQPPFPVLLWLWNSVKVATISAALIVGFIVIHVGLVIWTGLFNNMRSMITGWFVIEPPGSTAGPKLRRKPPADAGDAS